MDISKLLGKFETVEELRIYASSQFKQIQQLSKENKELKEKLGNAAKVVPTVEPLPSGANLEISKEDAKVISEIQLALLKRVSFDRELTTDEAKRVELYNRILSEEASKDKKQKADEVERLPAADLLKLVE